MELRKQYDQETLSEIRKLYLTAFPESERKPFELMEEKQRMGQMEILALAEEDGSFCGLAIAILYEDIVLLDYFAIADEKRGAGAGSRALALLQERYRGKRLLLEIESTREEAENRKERERRKNFYLRNHMEPMSYLVRLFGVNMEILCHECSVSYEEYRGVLVGVFGDTAARWTEKLD